eukprot:Gb_34983 [translate_table: standard]
MAHSKPKRAKPQIGPEDLQKMAHSPVHMAVAREDHDALRHIVSTLPRLNRDGEIRTEAEGVEEEERATAISQVIDRRDVPNRETPLHVAVRMGDAVSAELLMEAGADWSLQNEQGWNCLQEAVCCRVEEIVTVIMRHYQPTAWAKWCRRLPRLVSAMNRMRDFYMEISFEFESLVIPFVSRIAPSDTYRIWKRGSNLRVDMTLAGFDGFRFQRSPQSFLFFGQGSQDGEYPSGSLLILSHDDKVITDALADVNTLPTEAMIENEVASMFSTNVYRPGIDVTLSELVAQRNWRGHAKTEMVGHWKAQLYDMDNVMFSLKSRKVAGAMTTDEGLFDGLNEEIQQCGHDYSYVLTEEEVYEFETALKRAEENSGGSIVQEGHRQSFYGREEFYVEEKEKEKEERTSLNCSSGSKQKGSFECKEEKRGWISLGRKSNSQKTNTSRRSYLPEIQSGSDLSGNDSHLGLRNQANPRKHSNDERRRRMSFQSAPTAEEFKDCKEKGRKSAAVAPSHRYGHGHDGSTHESEYKKGLKPVFWLTQQFPLQIEELLPLLDILADKVKAVRRVRDLLAVKLPKGTFPVKVAIPVVPTIKVVVTFTRFDELQPLEDFSTPWNSPSRMDTAKRREDVMQESSNSWFQWIKAPYNRGTTASTSSDNSTIIEDPFLIPSDYTCTNKNARRSKMKKSNARVKNGRKSRGNKAGD